MPVSLKLPISCGPLNPLDQLDWDPGLICAPDAQLGAGHRYRRDPYQQTRGVIWGEVDSHMQAMSEPWSNWGEVDSHPQAMSEKLAASVWLQKHPETCWPCQLSHA